MQKQKPLKPGVWLELAVRCGYLNKEEMDPLAQEYEFILGKQVKMMSHPDHWTVRQVKEGDVTYGDWENTSHEDYPPKKRK